MINFLDIEHKLIPVVIQMETSGFTIDKEKLTDLKRELIDTKIRIEAKYPAVNLNSPKQVREHLIASGYQKELSTYVTYNQVPSVDKLVLKRLVNSVPMCKDLLEYREVSKLLGTYVEAMSNNTIWCGNFNQCGTITGRFSSSKPNLQNIPSRTELGRRVRKCLIAKPGHKLIISDLSQIEPRLYAFFSQDGKLLAVYRTDGDFHTAVTKTIYSLNGTPPTKDQRFVGKTIGLATLYGAGTNKLVETLVKHGVFLKDKEVQNIRNKIKAGYKEAINWSYRYRARVGNTGTIETILKRQIPMVTGMNPVNTRIQASCADILKVGMVNIHLAGYKIIATAHDEVVCEVPDYLAGIAAREISELMEDSVQLEGISIKAETIVGDSWGDK